MELFENYAYKLQSQTEWKEWYCLPFLKNPEENPTFSVYFSKNWIDTFIISLQNFLNIIFQSIQYPRLLSYEEDLFGYNKFVGTIPKAPTPIVSNYGSIKIFRKQRSSSFVFKLNICWEKLLASLVILFIKLRLFSFLA
jgi:hypothetical protein